MIKTPIVVMDSGVGGLTVLNILTKRFPYERFIYLSDCKNMPYGNKSKKDIEFFCKKNLKRVKKYNPKAIVVACNTMSLNGEEILKKNATAPVFFVRPNLKKMHELGIENCLLLCTELSAKSGAISPLSNICSHSIIPLATLASQIEKNPFKAEGYLNVEIIEKIKLKKYIFLGCTHYIFLLKTLKKLFPNKIIFDGTEDISENLARICGCKFSNSAVDCQSQIQFIGSGSGRVKSIFRKICNKR